MLLSADTFLAPGSAPERLWLNRFAGLGPTFYSHVAAAPLRDPYWVARSDALARDLGLPALNPAEDRVMICGSPEMLRDLKHMMEERGFNEGNTTKPGDFVIERAFAEQ